MTKPSFPGFAPTDPTDGREPLEWGSKYDPEAQREIRFEAKYLAALLLAVPVLSLVLWIEYPKRFLVPDQKYKAILKYGLAWLGGTLGGTLFDIKWLYHTVARKSWHMDRRLWRLFTPHISGGLAFAFVALISSGILRVFDQRALDSLSMVVAVSFMVGYFSDNAAAKLLEIALTLFGSSHKGGKFETRHDADATDDHARGGDGRKAQDRPV